MAVAVLPERWSAHIHARTTLWLPMVAMVAFLGIYLPVAATSIHTPTPNPSPAIVQATKKFSAFTPVTTTAHAAQPNCTPTSFGQPTGLDLSTAPAGLSVQADNPVTYHIYGDTADALRLQIEHCAPGSGSSSLAEFTADTSYNMTWQYYTVIGAGNACSLTDVKVGVHTATIMPLWQPTSSAAEGLPTRWQSFSTDLLTHEQGHVALDKQYAAKVLADLNALPAMNCDDLTSTVKSTINSDVSALNNANNNYDAATDHGATQGAVIPSY